MKKRIYILLNLLFVSISLFSQSNTDYERFMSKSQGLSNLYRGTAPLNYRFKFTGTYFAYSEDFKQGDICFNEKIYHNILINLNSHLDELYLHIPESGRYVVLNRDFVSRFNMENRKFINSNHIYIVIKPSSLNGFCEILFEKDGVLLLKKIIKTYAERINHFTSTDNNSKLERMFNTSHNYYLIKDQKAYHIKNYRDISNALQFKVRDIKRYSRENDLDYREDKDLSFYKVVEFIQSNNRAEK